MELDIDFSSAINDNIIKSTAKDFDMTITSLAASMGYTRQGLYAAINGGHVQNLRMIAALDHLKLFSDVMFEGDLEAAREKVHRREKRLEYIANKFGLVWKAEKN